MFRKDAQLHVFLTASRVLEFYKEVESQRHPIQRHWFSRRQCSRLHSRGNHGGRRASDSPCMETFWRQFMNALFLRISDSCPSILRIGVLLLGTSGLFGEFSPVLAQLHGGRGPSIVRSAWNLEPGYLTLAAHTRFYGKVAEIPSSTGSTIPTAIWDVQGGFSLNYGIGRHFEGSIA